MSQWLSTQADYGYFVYGLVFFILAITVRSLRQQKASALPWGWLLAFGVTQGAGLWLAGLLHGWPSPVGLALGLVIRLLSFLCLLEFGRIGLAALSRSVPGRWVYVPLLCLVAAFLGQGLATLQVVVHYAVALPAGVLAALALWHGGAPRSRGLQVAAWAMAGYAVLTGLLPAPWVPAAFLNETPLPRGLNGPAQVVRGGLMLGVALSLWWHYRRGHRSTIHQADVLGWWYRLCYLVLPLFLALGWFTTDFMGRSTERRMRADILGRVRLIAAATNSERLRKLTGTRADLGNADYQMLKQHYMSMRQVDHKCRFVYAVGLHNERVFFFLDSEAPDSPAYSTPGDFYLQASDVLRGVFRTGRADLEGPLPGPSGWWLSAYAPVTDAAGHVLAVTGLDLNANDWTMLVANQRMWPMLVQMLIMLFFLGGFVMMQRWQEMADRLAGSERQYRGLFEDTASPMFLMDPNKEMIVEVNPAAAAFYGYAREAMAGLPVNQLFYSMPEEQRGLKEKVLNNPLTIQCRCRLADGQMRDVDMALSPLQVHGELCWFAIVRDITEQKLNAEQLLLQNAALTAAANGIVITDSAGKILWVNPAFIAMTGYPLPEILGQTSEFLKSGKHAPAFYEEIAKVMRDGQVWRGEIISRRKDGQLYTEDMTITPVRNTAGEITHFIEIKQDVTEQRTLQQQFLQAQKMESIGRLAAGIAHDFNNQLQGIIGFSDLLRRTLAEGDTRRADVEEIRKAAHQAAALTRQLMIFGRRHPLEMQVLDLNRLIQDGHKLHQRLVGEDLVLELRLAAELDRIKADPGQMEQVLMNLLVNARDAMPEGGRVTISTFNLTMNARDIAQWTDMQPGRFVVLAVSDTGVGIPPDVLPHIFEPFFTTKGMDRGTGLGLATVYGVARQHGGWVHVYSTLGAGTTFKVYIPALVSASLPSNEPVPVSSEQDVKGNGQHILLVEDEDGVREFALRVLRENNYNVVAAGSLTDALKQYEAAAPFELVLSDVVLPDGNGLDLVEKLLARQPGLRVVMASGYTDERSRWPAIQARGLRFIPKPYPMAALLQAVHDVLHKPVAS